MDNWLEESGLYKFNYKGQLIPAVAGIILILVLVFSYLIFIYMGLDKMMLSSRLIFLVIIIGCAGFVDDLMGHKDYQGFKGHFTQLMTGKLTTGAFKAIISLAAVLLAVNWVNSFSLVQILVRIGVILLMTNFFNLLDVRPGRALKFFLFLSVVILIIMPVFTIYFLPVYFFITLYIPFELQGRIMLGDTGSNVLGLITGFILSKWKSEGGIILIFLLLVLLTFLSERYSFSKFISRNQILNWVDLLGRKDL